MDLVTTVMELCALLLLIAAAAVAVAAWSLPAGLATAGLGLLVGSWLVERRSTPKGPQQ